MPDEFHAAISAELSYLGAGLTDCWGERWVGALLVEWEDERLSFALTIPSCMGQQNQQAVASRAALPVWARAR